MEQKQYQVLSGSTLKLIAVITMLIDHTTLWIMTLYPLAGEPLFHLEGPLTYYWLGRSIGRIAFPIYCFLIAEGSRHTHDKKQYGIRLLLFALVSEIPWDLLHYGTVFQPKSQNVFFTLLLGYCCILVYEKYRGQFSEQLTALLGLLIVDMLIGADYGIRGMALILLLYLLHESPILMGLLGCCFLNEGAATLPAFFLIGMYNGKRGFVRGRLVKYFFYAFYPLHLLVLWLLRQRLGGA